MLACVMACAAPQANAKDFAKVAEPGNRTHMHTYAHWSSKDCSPRLGVVKLLTKPQHGKLMPIEKDDIIRKPGTRHPGSPACVGKSTPTFQVYYTSDSDFRGVDHFKIQVEYKGFAPEVDTFTVNVR